LGKAFLATQIINMNAHEIDFKVFGEEMQFAVIELDIDEF